MPQQKQSSQKDTSLAYWAYGNPKNPPLVMIHGFTGDHQGFQYMVPLLEDDYYVIIPDLPGFGESPLPGEDMTIADIAARTNAFVQSLTLSSRPYLVSHSMGGLIAASMLDQASDLYHDKTVFIAPASTPIKLLDSRAIGSWLGKAQYGIGKTVPSLGPKLVTNHTISRLVTRLLMVTKDTDLRARIFQHHIDNFDYLSSIPFYYNIHREITSSGAIDYADAVSRHSVLIIAGEIDDVTPLRTIKLFARATNAQLDIVPGAGHLAQYERPGDIVAAMQRFLV